MGRETTKIKDMLKDNKNKIYPFVIWYVDSDRSKESFNKEVKPVACVEYEYAMKDWILKEDVQEAVKGYLKQKRTLKMMEIYDKMFKKASEDGDVNAAKWVESFFRSDFFNNGEDEIEDFLSGVNIPALKGGGD